MPGEFPGKSRRQMKKCAFLTMDNMEGFVSDDELAVEPLAALGWQVEFVSWRQTTVPWRKFDLVVLRTTWDYQNDPEAFLTVLAAIEMQTRLENELSLVRWNLSKTYLADLKRRGVGIVPTLWDRDLTRERLQSLLGTFSNGDLVIKPVVGANADDTFRLAHSAGNSELDQAVAAFRGRSYLAQPFLSAIIEEGEFSLFFFAGVYSHAIQKRPTDGDFRVQEEHGGSIDAVEAELSLLQQAKIAVDAIEPLPLYARVDMVRNGVNEFLVMELELIEPSLYLRMDAVAPQRFARALDTWMR